MKRNNLRYTRFYGDGDRKSYLRLKDFYKEAGTARSGLVQLFVRYRKKALDWVAGENVLLQ